MGACLALILGSFGDEAAQVAFALRLAGGGAAAPAQVAVLLAAGLLGGISAGAVAPRAIVEVGARRLISSVFIAEAVLIAVASLADSLWWFVAVAAALGCLGSVIWSAVMVTLPSLDLSEEGVDRANRFVQTMRNLGYVAGPLLGSALYAGSSDFRGLLALASLMLAAAVGAAVALRRLVAADVGRAGSADVRRVADVRGLLQTHGVLRALAPLLITVLVTSALNVLLIVRVRTELHLSAATYGFVIAALSAGLVLGPALFSGFVSRLGDAAGASVGAAVIGGGVVAIGAADVHWQLVAAAAVIGIANGVQNALMGSFIIKRVDPARRASQMPAYVLLLQTTVLVGFLGAAFIDVHAAGRTLIAVGLVAAVAGTVGALVNRTKRSQLTKEGVSS